MSLAYELGLPLEEVLGWSIDTYAAWQEFFKIKAEAEKRSSQRGN